MQDTFILLLSAHPGWPARCCAHLCSLCVLSLSLVAGFQCNPSSNRRLMSTSVHVECVGCSLSLSLEFCWVFFPPLVCSPRIRHSVCASVRAHLCVCIYLCMSLCVHLCMHVWLCVCARAILNNRVCGYVNTLTGAGSTRVSPPQRLG